MNSEQHKIKGMESRLLPLKKIFSLVGLDWRPTQEMIEAVKGKPYADNNFWEIPDDQEDKENYFLKLYDPRKDFFPGNQI